MFGVIQDRFYWYRLTRFLVNFIIALESVLVEWTSVELFIPAVLMTIDAAALAYMRPFDNL